MSAKWLTRYLFMGVIVTVFFVAGLTSLVAWQLSVTESANAAGTALLRSIITAIGALTGFLAGTMFKYGFDRARDKHLEETERKTIAAALRAELLAIEDRCREHVEWLANGYQAWARSRAVTDMQGQRIVTLPEMYPIYYGPIFDAVKSKIGMFKPEALAAIVKAYDLVHTNARRADRYVNLTVEDVSGSLPRALREMVELIDHAERAVDQLSLIASLPRPHRPIRSGAAMAEVILKYGVSQTGTCSSGLPASTVHEELKIVD